MKQIFTLLFLLVVGLGTLSRARAGQDYAPQPGETVIRFDIENRGSIFVRLYTKEAPNTSAQVLSLVRRGFYNEQKFFRVERRPKPYIAMFGDPQTKTMELDHPNVGSGGSGKTVPFESNSLTHDVGAVSFAHPRDSKDGDSQFFFVLGAAKFLDGQYTVFGRVVSGIEILPKIERGDKVSQVRVISG
jgi:cyclophilin family peptidyl-prolyl cis-trans isomerase